MSHHPSILVTGGAGFIGSHLVRRLLAQGQSVTIIDDLSTGRLANLADIESHPELRIIVSRVSEYKELKEIVAQSQRIYHLAAAVGVEMVINSPIRTIQNNLLETEIILEAACANQTPVLLASTSEVYGKSLKESFAETDDLLIGPPTLGRWSYACSKLMDEFLGLAYHKERGVPVIIARLFNTVGPRQTGRYGMVLPRFIEAAQTGRALEVYGDGLQTRCFCDVADTVEALLRLTETPASVGQIINVGSTEEVSILELAKRVLVATSS
ncbi:MAG: NAD-dependent epimerase/dehydratase family protein, partial [Verrucomicrobia bacterium]